MWDIDPKYLQKDETIEYVDRPSMLSCVFAYGWAGLMIITGISVFIAGMIAKNGMVFMSLIYFILALPAVLFILNKLSTRYAISNRGLLTRTGIITTSVKTVPFKHVTSIEIKENILGKMFRCGQLLIDTSGSGRAVELRWNYIKTAHQVKKLIESHIGGES
ncbi:MAG: PH domain-containing protein [Candidatus Eisenbacteria bacterium]|nr:PH domain-containing protein [Candidatus Eisenbacteria bacterium]